MRQRFGVAANVAPNTCWIQFINHANYKIIDLNVMDWANATKIHTPPVGKRYFPPWRACAAHVQRQCSLREWRAIESHCWHRTGAWWKSVVHVLWTRNINAWGVLTKWHLRWLPIVFWPRANWFRNRAMAQAKSTRNSRVKRVTRTGRILAAIVAHFQCVSHL